VYSLGILKHGDEISHSFLIAKEEPPIYTQTVVSKYTTTFWNKFQPA